MKKVTLVLGLGISGLAAAEFLIRQDHLVLGIDNNRSLIHTNKEIHRLQSLGLFVQHDSEPIDWQRVTFLVVSPGVSPQHPLYRDAERNGIKVIGEAELALPHFRVKLIAVTGTNGKTTVTLLVTHILNSVGIKTKALGNVGTPLCNSLLEPGDEEAFVVELSSYQLETMHTPVFDAAVLLNITPDHLDRYPDMNGYARAKCRLQYLVKNACPFFVQKEAAAQFKPLLSSANIQSFDTSDCILPLHYKEGSPDWENALAAWALCKPFSITSEQFCSALATFKKPPHRLEFVCEINGVCFYNDSKGTNLDAVIKAVNAMKRPVILIAGGVDKGASYLLWKEHFSNKVKQIIAIGEAAPKIYSELHAYFNIKLVDTLSAAVHLAAEDAEKGDAVLLSPGCSSFDMFRDYVHRGEEFQHCIKLIKGEYYES